MCFAIYLTTHKDITYRSASVFDALTVQAGHAKYHLAETSDVYREQDPFLDLFSCYFAGFVLCFSEVLLHSRCTKEVKLADVAWAKGFGFYQETL